MDGSQTCHKTKCADGKRSPSPPSLTNRERWGWWSLVFHSQWSIRVTDALWVTENGHNSPPGSVLWGFSACYQRAPIGVGRTRASFLPKQIKFLLFPSTQTPAINPQARANAGQKFKANLTILMPGLNEAWKHLLSIKCVLSTPQEPRAAHSSAGTPFFLPNSSPVGAERGGSEPSVRPTLQQDLWEGKGPAFFPVINKEKTRNLLRAPMEAFPWFDGVNESRIPADVDIISSGGWRVPSIPPTAARRELEASPPSVLLQGSVTLQRCSVLAAARRRSWEENRGNGGLVRRTPSGNGGEGGTVLRSPCFVHDGTAGRDCSGVRFPARAASQGLALHGETEGSAECIPTNASKLLSHPDQLCKTPPWDARIQKPSGCRIYRRHSSTPIPRTGCRSCAGGPSH